MLIVSGRFCRLFAISVNAVVAGFYWVHPSPSWMHPRKKLKLVCPKTQSSLKLEYISQNNISGLFIENGRKESLCSVGVWQRPARLHNDPLFVFISLHENELYSLWNRTQHTHKCKLMLYMDLYMISANIKHRDTEKNVCYPSNRRIKKKHLPYNLLCSIHIASWAGHKPHIHTAIRMRLLGYSLPPLNL